MTQGKEEIGSESSSRPMEMPAVKTTIVGGRPPGCGKMLGAIPRGIEVLVKKASVDPDFRALLLARRSAAAEEIGLKLAPAEVIMLDHVPQAQLEAIINRTRVDPSRRNAFLSKAAGVMLAALGAGASVDCVSWGIRPDQAYPPATQPATQPASNTATQPGSHGVRPGKPATTSASSGPAEPASKPAGGLSRGIRPDVPPDLRGASGDSVLIAADETPPQPVPPPPLPPPPRPGMRVAGVMVGPIAGPPTTLPASAPVQTQPTNQSQPATHSTSSGQAQPAPPLRPERVMEVAGARAAPPPAPSPPWQGAIAGMMAVPAETPPPAQTQPGTPSTGSGPAQPALSPKEIDDLVKQMDDDNYTVREAAQKKLQDQGIRILPALRAKLQGEQLSAEVRSRLESIVNTLAATTQPAVRPADVRARRGLTVGQ